MATALTPLAGFGLIAGFTAFMLVAVQLAFRHRAFNTRISFLLAGARLPWQLSGFAIAATWTWAIAVFVAAEKAYLTGWVGLFWFAVPNILALAVFSFGAKRIREIAPVGFTLSGAMRDRFSPRVQHAYQLTLISLATASSAVQLLAGGLIASTLTGIDFTVITIALAGAAMLYTFRVGFGASVLSDLVNLVFILGFGGLISVWIVREASWTTLVDGLGGVSGQHTSLFTGAGALVFLTFGINSVVTLLTGPWGDNNYWQFGWATEQRHVQKAFLFGAALFALIPVTMGIVGLTAAGAGLDVANTQLTNLAAILHWLPAWTVYPFLLYVLGVLITTIDSNYSVIAAFMGHDFSRGRDDANAVKRARLAIVGLTALSVGIANLPGITLIELWFFYGTFRIATFLPTVFALFTRRPSEFGMFWGITAACAIGVPLSAYGNLLGDWRATVAAALLTMAISGTIAFTVKPVRRNTR